MIIYDHLNDAIDIGIIKTTSIFLAIIAIALPLHAYRKNKEKTNNYISITHDEIKITFGDNVNSIPASTISKYAIFNIFGNKNFVIWHSEKTSAFLLNGLKFDITVEIAKHQNIEIVTNPSFFETFKYLISSLNSN